jgi:hypothetical protein
VVEKGEDMETSWTDAGLARLLEALRKAARDNPPPTYH